MDESSVLKEKENLERERKGSLFVLILTIVVLLMHTVLFYPFANRAEPFVMGLPFSIFWTVLWICIEFVGLVVAYELEFKRR
jgi:hypothetical protein